MEADVTVRSFTSELESVEWERRHLPVKNVSDAKSEKLHMTAAFLSVCS